MSHMNNASRIEHKLLSTADKNQLIKWLHSLLSLACLVFSSDNNLLCYFCIEKPFHMCSSV